MEAYLHITALFVGWLLDRFLGDPPWMPHPVVAFGKIIARGERWLNQGKYRVLKGSFFAFLLVMLTVLGFYALLAGLEQIHNWLKTLAEVLFFFTGLAGTTLIREGKSVFKEVDKSLEAGRQQVGRIVGRDTRTLSSHEVKTATLETLAENLSDGVVAPLFWFAVGGIPGMMGYKMINTLDSMIGYKNDRFLEFGRFAAKLDDVVNFIPARITAFLMALGSMSTRAWRFVFTYGKAHSSPNAGYPEAALAGILNVQFGGAHDYFGTKVDKPVIGLNPRPLKFEDLQKTIKINRTVETLMVLLVMVFLIFIR